MYMFRQSRGLFAKLRNRNVFSRRLVSHSVLCFEGDGVGPEAVASSKQVISAAGVDIQWIDMPFGFTRYESLGEAVTEEHLTAFEDIKVIFKGSVTIPPGDTNFYCNLRGRSFTSPNQVFRKIFQLYANVRPGKTYQIKCIEKPRFPEPDIDIVTIRENTEDLYTGEERWVDDDTVESIKRITRNSSTRIARFAFEYARKHNRKKVTSVHKANVTKHADGLFLDCVAKVAQEYPEIESTNQLADSLLTKIVIEPTSFDILCCPNLYGDLISDLVGGIIGSLGLMPAGLYNSETNLALFEPTHGSAPDIAGKDLVNPISQWRSAIMMLEHLGEIEAANRIEKGIEKLLADGIVTPDLNGTDTCSSMTTKLVRLL